MKRTEYTEGYEFSFVAYTGAEMNEKRPLIIQLHGAGERGNGKDELQLVDKHGFSKYLKEAEHDCIVVMPQCPADSFWAARVESIVRFVGQMIEKFHADPDRVCLTGLSMGGYGTWFTAMARPDLFAAIAPVCGGGMAWNAGVLTMPIWTCHGAKDETVSINQTEEMVAALRALGRDVTYERLEDYGHNAWDYAYTERLMNWLLSKKRG